MLKFPTPGYDTETVRQLVEQASGTPTSTQDIWNLSRAASPLGKAQIRPGFFHKTRVQAVVKSMLRRRLLAQLGRRSPRLPGAEFETRCRTCGGIAVIFEGRWLCENGHGGNTNE